MHSHRFHASVANRAMLLPAILLMMLPAIGTAADWHVKTDGNDASAGTSWGLAKRTVGAALAAAANGDQVWVARGTYQERVSLNKGVALYGGFAGTESSLDQRDWESNPTLLDGGGQGVVVSVNTNGQVARVDGMRITGGSGIYGGGMEIIASAPTIANNTFYDNIANGAGAGICVWGSDPLNGEAVITRNLIRQNRAMSSVGDGDGIAVVAASPQISWNVIYQNIAQRNGGGIGCWKNSQPLIANNLILANSASFSEGAYGMGGGIYGTAGDFDNRPVTDAVCAPVVVNNLLAANGAYFGGGCAFIDSLLGAASVRNNTVVANNGAGIYFKGTAPTLSNNQVCGNVLGIHYAGTGSTTAVLRFNNVHGNTLFGLMMNYMGIADPTGTDGNLSSDPLFANQAPGDFRLQPDSPSVDHGDAGAVEPDWPDLANQTRTQGAAVDIGAYESTGAGLTVATPVVRVSPSGSNGDGATWATAKRTVQAAIDQLTATIGNGGEIWVAQGTYVERPVVPAFVALYGGFAGNEASRAARNPTTHTTILDGGGTAPVVTSWHAGYLTSVIDGFTIQNGGTYTGGNPGAGNPGGHGGGVLCPVSSPRLANNVIRRNSLGMWWSATDGALGGGAYFHLSYAVIESNSFTENEILNKDTGTGGGIHCIQSGLAIVGNTFSGNAARYGAAVSAAASSPLIMNNTVTANGMYVSPSAYPYAGAENGAVYLNGCGGFPIEANTIDGNVAHTGAGIAITALTGASVVRNNVVSNNQARDPTVGGGMGGGILCSTVNYPLQIVNNTIVGNLAYLPMIGGQGGGIAIMGLNAANTLLLANNIIANNSDGIYRNPGDAYSPVLTGNCLDNTIANYSYLTPGVTDIQVPPSFVDAAAKDYHLNAASPCIDAGGAANAPATDRDGMPRPLDGNHDGTAVVDIGAYETVDALADSDSDGIPDGWTNQYFGHPTGLAADKSLAGSDASGTGQTNWFKYLADLNPLDPASRFTVRVELVAGQPDQKTVVFSPRYASRNYVVKYSTTLADGMWTAITGSAPVDNGTERAVTDLEAIDKTRFYRIEISKP